MLSKSTRRLGTSGSLLSVLLLHTIINTSSLFVEVSPVLLKKHLTANTEAQRRL